MKQRIHRSPLPSLLLAASLAASTSVPVTAENNPWLAPNPAVDNAEVRMPYGELRKLWEAAALANQPKDTKEPEKLPAGALLSARYTVDVSSGRVVMEAEYKVESFAGKWERIPLVNGGLSVASVEPGDARLVISEGALCFMAKEPGQTTAKVCFVETPLQASAEVPFLNFIPAATAIGSLEVKGIPAGRLLKLRDGEKPARAENPGAVALPTKGGSLALYLTDAASEPKPEPPPAPPQPSDWILQNEVLVLEGEGELTHRVRVHAMASNGSALEATVLLPGNARAVKLEGAEDLADWKLIRNNDGFTEVRIRWKTRDVIERDFKLSYALQQLPLAPAWELRAPILTKGKDDKTKSLFMFILPAGTEFTAPGLQGPVPAAKLSKWVATEAKSAEFGTVMGGGSVTLQSRLLPRLETATAVVTKSEYTTRLISDGSVLTEGTLEVSHDDSLRWTFTLPEKSDLLRCLLDGAAIRPVARDGGVMEIPLTHSGDKTTQSKVVISYTSGKPKLEAVEGQVALELPQTPFFIQEVIWSLELPDAYEISATEGNLENTSTSTSVSAVRLVKKLCRDERPQTTLFYSKRSQQ